MPDVLGAGLRWLRGEKGKSFKEPIEACVGPDVVESRRLHLMARNMGLESDSEEERLNNRSGRSERHRERVKHRPPPERYSPEGSSRSGTTIDCGKTGGYQKSIWLKEGDHSSDSDRLPKHDSPLVTMKNTRNSPDYPNTNQGPSGNHGVNKVVFHRSIIARKEANDLNTKCLAELAIINRRNEEEILRQRRERKLLNATQESEESDEDYYKDTPRKRRQYEEDKRLFKEYQARQREGKLLPPPLPPKLPLSHGQRPSPPSRSATLPPESPIPFRPAPLIENNEPHNAWPGNIKSPPDPRTSTVMPPPRRNTVSSDAWENNPRAPPYPVTPHNYHLNGYNNQNDVQKRAVHDAFKDMMFHGHERIAGPTPPTFRSSYPDAVELSGISTEMQRDGMRRHAAAGNKILGDRSQTPAFAVRIDMDVFHSATIQETEEERTGSGRLGVERMELHGGGRRTGKTGDRRRERPVPEIRVQRPTPGASLWEPHSLNIRRARRSADIERLAAPRSEHGNHRKHEKHGKHEKH